MIHLSKYLYLAAIIVIVVFSACSGNSNDEPENGGGNETGTLVLRTSATVIEANGQDAAVFTVMKGNSDVTKLLFIRLRLFMAILPFLPLQKEVFNFLPAITARFLIKSQCKL